MPTALSRPSPASPSQGTSDPRWYVLPAALLAYFLRFGYDYGVSDQDEFIPYLLHLLDPDLFTADWFVQAQLADVNVRSAFVWLLRLPAEVLPVWACVLLAYVACWLLIGGAVWMLTVHLLEDRRAAALAVVLVLVATPQWTLGGNDLVHSVLTPSLVGWTLALWGSVWVLRGRMAYAGLLVGAATWMQALVGLQVAGLLGVWLLVRERRREGAFRWRPVLVFAATFLLVAVPWLAPIVEGQMAGGATASTEPSLFTIMAIFRLPHHYLPSAFPASSFVKVGALAVIGGLGLWRTYVRGELRHGAFVLTMLVMIAALCLVGLVFTEGVPWLAVAKLQLFKTTVLAKVLLVIGISGAASMLLPDPLRSIADRLLALGRWGVLGIVLLGTLTVGLVLTDRALDSRARPMERLHAPEGTLYSWVRTHTDTDARFAVPPSWSAFRTYAQRSIVVNFKSIPFTAPLIREWFDRLRAWAPIDRPERVSREVQQRLDSAYVALPPSTRLRLARDYDVDYVVLPPAAPRLGSPFEPVFRNEAGTVYAIASPSRPES